MSALRDLVVSVDFDDININSLLQIDSAMDQITSQFSTMGGQISNAGGDFSQLGSMGGNALNEITSGAENAGDALGEVQGDASHAQDALNELGDEGQDVGDVIDNALSDAQDALTDTETAADHAADAMDELGDEANQAGNQGSDALDELEDSADHATDASQDLEHQMHNTSDATGSLGGSVKKLIGIVAGFIALDKIKDLGISMVEAAASATATSAQFAQVFEGMEDAAAASLGGVAKETNILSGRLKGSFLGMAAFAKTTGMETADALALTERATLAAADGAAFYDKSIEEVSDSLQSFLKGNFANDAALGISATETTRNATANKLYGKSFKDLGESQKQLTLLQMVEDGNKLSGALGQAAREGDGFENVIGNLKQSWTDLMAKSGDKLLEPVVNVVKGMTGAIKEFDPQPVIDFLEKSVNFGGKVAGVFGTIKETIMSLYYDTGEVSDLWQNLGLSKGASDAVAEVADVFKTVYDVVYTIKESIMSLWYDTGEVSDLWQKIGLSEKTGDMLAVIGEVLRSTVTTGFEIATDAFTMFKDLLVWGKDNLDTVAAGLFGVVGGLVAFKIINTVTSGIGLFTTLLAAWRNGTILQTMAQWGLNTAMLANPMMWVAVAIGAVIAIGVLLWQNWDTISAKAGELWSWIKDAWSGIWNSTKEIWSNVTTAIGDALQDAWDWVKDIASSIGSWLAGVWDGIVSAASAAWEWLSDVIGGAFTATKEGVTSTGKGIASFFIGLWEGIVSGVKAVWEPIEKVISGPFNFAKDLIYVTAKLMAIGLITILNWILEKAAIVWTFIKDTAISIWTKIKDGVMAVANVFWQGITTVFNAISTGVLYVWDLLITGIQTAWNFAVNTVMGVANFLWTGITNIFNFILETAATVWEGIKNAISVPFGYVQAFVITAAMMIWNKITYTFNAVLETVTMVWNTVKTTITTAFTAAKDFIVETATTIWNTVVEKFDAVKTTITDVMEKVKTKISEAMNDAKTSTTNFFDPLMNFVQKAKDLWDGFVDAVKKFKMPSIKIPSAFGGGDKKDGSHATGLARVPFDGYMAELHKDEAVLTANQSDALRRTGVLDNAGSKPKLALDQPEITNKINIPVSDQSPNQGEKAQPIAGSTNNATTNVNTFAPQITIQIEGGQNGKVDHAAVAQAVKREMEKFWMQMNLNNA